MEVYYKRLIKQYGLWYSPQWTAKIIKEAKSYNYYARKDLKMKFHWKDIAKDLDITTKMMSEIVTGKRFPSRVVMEKLIKYLDLTIDVKENENGKEEVV